MNYGAKWCPDKTNPKARGTAVCSSTSNDGCLSSLLLVCDGLRPKDVDDLGCGASDGMPAAVATSGPTRTPIHPTESSCVGPKVTPRASALPQWKLSDAAAEVVSEAVISSAGYTSSKYLGCGNAVSSSVVWSAIMSSARLSASASE